MEFKKLIGILTITVSVIILGLFAFSLAWYSFSNAQTSFSTNTLDGVSIIFAQSQYINTTTGIPISASDVDDKADKTIFTVGSDSTLLSGYTLAIQISLVDITIDQALRESSYFKYQLLQTVNGTTTTVASGTGLTIGTNTEVVLKSMSTVTVGTTYTYELRVWLEDSGSSQNDLMQKNFSAKIQVSSAAKK